MVAVDVDVLDAFHPLVAGWFRDRFGAPTEPQTRGWPHIGAGEDVLIAAPTGSGKTLAAFLSCLDTLVRRALASSSGGSRPMLDGTEILYVSPLKALSNDVQRNLEGPLAELRERAARDGVRFPDITVGVRTGDTPDGERAKMAKRPPHILVTTPESLYILLTSGKGRAALGGVRTVIVDEIHAIAGDKRGAHLALSLERLDRLTTQTVGARPVRIGLSATQRPIERIARLLVGTRRPMPHIVDGGHRRAIDLAIEITDDELAAVASNEQFGRVYDRIAELVTQHRSTIVFVNTRRLVERAAAALEQRLGEEHVVAHHGSMSRALRLAAEQKLKHGQVKCAVATASLELGIDVGTVDLVVQLGSPRSIGTLLQRIGRSGHHLGATPKGRLFAMTRDQLVECASLVRGIKRGNLDEIVIRDAPLDILAQQIVASCAAEDIPEAELVDMVRGATPYATLADDKLEQILTMISEGVSDRRGRFGAHVHRDRVAGMLRGRRGARLAAITSGGAIPDNNNYAVVQWPEETRVGEIEEDFAIESSAGDVFQLGNTAWKIKRVENGRVIVEDARGQPPTIPFWLGEAPARTRELSDEVSVLRGEICSRLADHVSHDDISAWLADAASMSDKAAQQMVAYLAAARTALGALPTNKMLVAERFFDEGGGMQLVIHAPLGGRINRAWGLALRKKFCVSFDFELQASATDDGIVISLGQPHSFALDTVFGYVASGGARETLIQALLDRPMFEIRWRWNVTRSLTVLRRRNGKRVPPQLVKMRAADTLSVVFPHAQACPENLTGPREIPDHPLVFETIRDCLVEAMDGDGLTELMAQLERGEIQVMARDTVEPSVLSHELINANPYAFLDDAPLEERRTRAVQLRRGLPSSRSGGGFGVEDIGALDPEAIAAASEEVAPVIRDIDELHDALMALWLVPEASMGAHRDALEALGASGRACRLAWGTASAWVATERLGAIRIVLGETVECTPALATPSWATPAVGTDRESVIVKVVGAHLDHRGPVSARELAAELGLALGEVLVALLGLESDGAILRGSFTRNAPALRRGGATVRDAIAATDDTEILHDLEWCNRRVLARIHRMTLARLRREIEPVSAAALMRFLLRWQRVGRNTKLIGADGLARVVDQLQGFETAAGAWEKEILPARLHGYDASWLDQMCLAGHVAWCRLSPRKQAIEAEAEDISPSPSPIVAPRKRLADGSGAHRWPAPATMFAPTSAGLGPVAAEIETPLKRAAVVRSAPSRSAPLSLLLRKDMSWLRAAAAVGLVDAPALGPVATRVRDHLAQTGASFLGDMVDTIDDSPDAIEDALWELVGAGLATADGFASLRVLVDRRRGEVKSHFDKGAAKASLPPGRKWQEAIRRARTRDRGRPAHALRSLPTAAGRWSLLPVARPEQIDAEKSARQLLHRYGVVFRDLITRESSLPPWRDMLVSLRRLEARGEIRGGRFVSGFVGEQFALPEALDELRGARDPGVVADVCRVAATDPLNLVGILSPGPRVSSVVGNAVLFVDGHAVASLEGGEIVRRSPIPMGARIDDDLAYHPPPRPVLAPPQTMLPL